jgi:hypothetical protein
LSHIAASTMLGFAGLIARSIAPVVLFRPASTLRQLAPPSSDRNTPRSPPSSNSRPCAATKMRCGLAGSMRIRPIEPVLVSPRLVHFPPPSIER